MSPISKPLAGKKLTKKLYKLVKKASGAKYVKRGVKEVVKVRQNLFGHRDGNGARRRFQFHEEPFPDSLILFAPHPIIRQGLKKGDKGLCLIAGDIYPIDVISHLPVLCEEKDTPYIYVPSKHDLGKRAVDSGLS